MDIDTSDWSPKIKDNHHQWEGFKGLQGVKRVISFGGWGFSTEPATYDVLRQAMSPKNRNKFANNIATFLSAEGLDGVDFDWEYPGVSIAELCMPWKDAGLMHNRQQTLTGRRQDLRWMDLTISSS